MTWISTRLKYLCVDSGQYGMNISSEQYAVEGARLIRTSDINEAGSLKSAEDAVYVANKIEKRHTLRSGDILLSRSGTIGRSLLVPELKKEATYAGYLVRFRPRDDTNTRFLKYVVQSARFQDAIQADAVSSTIQNFNAERYANIVVSAPDYREQCRIADFLDGETRLIDALQSARNRQIAVLKECELASILAQLSGSDDAGDRQPTGWPWMPRIPKGWRKGPVYSAYDVQLGKMLSPDRVTGAHLGPYLRNANVTWYQVKTGDLAYMNFPENEKLRYSVRPGDLLVCEGGAGVAEAAVWRSKNEVFYSKSLHRVRQRSETPVEWLMYWLRIAKAVGLFESEGNVATIPHLTGEQLREYRIPIPPDGQRRVQAIEERVESINSAISLLQRANDLAHERRQALITAAVTGKIDVATNREVAAR